MGKPFATEICAISETLEFSRTVEVSVLKQHVLNNLNNPFLIVGSGGSFAVATTCAMVINHLGGVAQAITPYELMEFSCGLKRINVVFFSAGGGNTDIINAYVFCKQMESNSSFIICLTENSKLISEAKKRFGDTSFLELNLPNGKDGFLAVNSTVCALVLLKKILDEKEYLINGFSTPDEIKESLHTDNIVALGGRWSLPVIYDFESKCTEAGLINVMPADLRNFAHGRHNWLAKNPNTSVICFVAENEYELAKKTLAILPKDYKKSIIKSDRKGIDATIDLFIQVFKIVQMIGENKGIDPGRPGVPRYGSYLYRLNHRLQTEAVKMGLLKNDILSRMVNRKKGVVLKDIEDGSIECAANKFLKKLSEAHFKCIVIDYDNTVIEGNNTTNEIYLSCMNYINSFLDNGVGVCFATGRGKSIRGQLCDVIHPDYANHVFIAYYNGALILPLNEDLPIIDDSINPQLKKVYDLIIGQLPTSVRMATLRNDCLTYEGQQDYLDSIFKLVSSYIFHNVVNNIKISKSDHSIDIFSESVSKKNAVSFMSERYGQNVLCIGDSGDEMGNDFELLDSVYSLSANKVSMSLMKCWNIASLGLRGPVATLEYLSKLQFKKKGLQFKKSYLLSSNRS